MAKPEVLMYAGPLPPCPVVYNGPSMPELHGLPCEDECGHPIYATRSLEGRHFNNHNVRGLIAWYTPEEKARLFK